MTLAPAPQAIRDESERSSKDVAWFVVLTFVLAWAWSIPFVVVGATVGQGEGWPTHVPALLAPLLAAVVVTGFRSGPGGPKDLVRRMGRWRFPPTWWLVVASPVLVLGLTLIGMDLAGEDLPAWSDFSMFNGLPAYGVFSTLLMVFVVNGLGEEGGWRGFLQDRLQHRFNPLPATLIVAAIWAVWHTPFFFILSTYSEFSPMTLVMFPLGLTSGAVVLAWIYNRTGRSILAVALWHTFYNMAVATAGASDLVQAVVTAAVMVAASVLVVAEIVVQHGSGASILGLSPEKGVDS